MAEELQETASGVPGTGEETAQQGVSAPGTAAPPTSATAAAAVDLTALPDFRKYQSERDRREAQLRQQYEAERQAKAQMEGRLRELEVASARARLQNADPEEIAQFYESEMARTRQEYEARMQAQEQRDRVDAEARDFLQKVGLSPDAPGLDFSGGPTPDGLSKLKESAAILLAMRARQAEESKATEAHRAVQQAMLDTAEQVGAVQVSAATGNSSPALREQYDKERAALRFSGRTEEYLALKRKYKELGLEL